MYTEEAIERFWSKVNKGSADECWIWQGAHTSHGYGHLTYRQQNFQAHRVSYELAYGPIPDGLCVCHRCDVRGCVNPAHLFLGTKFDNAQDMLSKGRGKHFVAYGENNPHAKFTAEQIAELRRLRPAGVKAKQEIANRHGVALGTIYAILSGNGWRTP